VRNQRAADSVVDHAAQSSTAQDGPHRPGIGISVDGETS
jgi:hypothetical protein